MELAKQVHQSLHHVHAILTKAAESTHTYPLGKMLQLKLRSKCGFVQLNRDLLSGPFPHSPLQLIVRRRVFGSDVGQLAEDLRSVDGEAGQQD